MDEWEFAVTPYVWFIFLDGDITIKGRQSAVNVSFGDIFEKLNFAGIVQAEARKGRLGGFVNTVFGFFGDDKKVF